MSMSLDLRSIILTRMKRRGITMPQIARMNNMSINAVRHALEKGKDPKMKNLERIANTVGLHATMEVIDIK